MKKLILSLVLLLPIIATAAEPCTSHETATPANIATCPFPDAAKATVVMDWMRDAGIQKSDSFTTLGAYLAGLHGAQNSYLNYSLKM